MAELSNKENLSPARHDLSPVKFQPISPLKSSRRARSKSIGADGIPKSPSRSSPVKDRRKSMFVPAPKSILPSKEDEAKRREARRKSLANRRVSFAPEATLHTWDVIEYMKEATASSIDSDELRRTSQASSHDDSELDSVLATPEGDGQARSQRRSSGIPPLNFNDPDDLLSSSPMSGEDLVEDSESENEMNEDLSDMDDDDTAMSMVSVENTADLTSRSIASAATSDSSARLDAALRQAAEQAGTRGIHFDEFGEQIEQEQDEVEQAEAWTQQGMLTPMAKNLIALQDQENVNPFSPAFSHAATGRPSTIMEEDEGDMSMEMTRAVGGILSANNFDSSVEDATMDFTQIGGRIFQAPSIKADLKRRRSTTTDGSPMNIDQQEVTSKRRRSSGEGMSEVTMDFTTAFGAINEPASQNATMEFTTAIGNILRQSSPIKVSRRQSVRRRRSSVQSTKSVDETMDFTTAIGKIQPQKLASVEEVPKSTVEQKEDEMSMDLTTAVGDVLPQTAQAKRPETPHVPQASDAQNPPTTPKDQGRFKDVEDLSARKLLTPMLNDQIPEQPLINTSARKILTPKSRLSRSPVKVAAITPIIAPTNAFAEVLRQSAMLDAGPGVHEAATSRSIEKTPFMSQQKIPRTPPSTSHDADRLSFLQQGPESHDELHTRSQNSPAPEKTQGHMLDNIRSMSTPRKENHTSPLKRLKEMTPKKTPLMKMRTPQRAFQSNVRFAPVETVTQPKTDTAQPHGANASAAKQESPIRAVRLSDFLSAAGIKFMDLSTTKRRYTAAPTPAKTTRARLAQEAEESEDAAKIIEEAVAAGACTAPELELYQHSCRELKQYISEGKTFVKQLESDVAIDSPAFMSAYMAAGPAQRTQLDVRLTDMKTRARLESKQVWYGWRTQLLKGLEDGLQRIETGISDDEAELARRNALLLDVFPAAVEMQEQLEQRLAMLEDAAAQSEHENKEELETARARLLESDTTSAHRRANLESLETELAEQERLNELYKDGKEEMNAAIEEAIRVREACRGVSTKDVATHQAALVALETSAGWRIMAAEGTSLTLLYRNALQLFFHPQAYALADTTLNQNQPISLTYVAEDAQSLTTEKRFFLQLMRAQLQMLDQSQTSVTSLLRFVSNGWETTATIAETIRRLALEERVAISILSDERLCVAVDMLLPAVQTKVQLAFEIAATIVEDDSSSAAGLLRLMTAVEPRGKVVYGEQYKEGKMGDFLGQRVGTGLEGAESAVRELRARLEKTGRKG